MTVFLTVGMSWKNRHFRHNRHMEPYRIAVIRMVVFFEIAKNWQLPVWLPFIEGSQGNSPDKMRLAAKGVSCNSTLEMMISLTFRRVYVEEKEKMTGKKDREFSMRPQGKKSGIGEKMVCSRQKPETNQFAKEARRRPET